MLHDPVGLVVFVLSLIYWSVAIFKPVKPKGASESTNQTGDQGSRFGALVASIGFLIVLTLATSAGLYQVLRGFESAPGRSTLLLIAVAFVGWLLLARPQRFAQLLIGGIFVFGCIGLLGKCSINGGESFEARPPRSL